MNPIRHCLLAAIACLLAGCAAAPDTGTLYLLDQTVIPTTPTTRQSAATLPILVLTSVKLAPYLTRRGIVYQTGPNRIVIADSNQWAAPLKDQLADGLYNALDSGLTIADVRRPAAAALVQPDFKLVVRITQFQGRYDGSAVISGNWRLFNSGGQLVGRRDFTQTTPLQQNGYAALVRALSACWANVEQSMVAAVGDALSMRQPNT